MPHLHARHDNAHGTRGGDDPSRATDGPACEAGSGHYHEHAGQDEKTLRRFFMAVQGAARHDSLDAILLSLTGLRRCPGAQGECPRNRYGYGPYPTRCSAFPDHQQRCHHRDWKQYG
jgi:hypothetical protein